MRYKNFTLFTLSIEKTPKKKKNAGIKLKENDDFCVVVIEIESRQIFVVIKLLQDSRFRMSKRHATISFYTKQQSSLLDIEAY